MWHRHRDVHLRFFRWKLSVAKPPTARRRPAAGGGPGGNASRPAASLGRCGRKRRTSRFGGEQLRARTPSRAEPYTRRMPVRVRFAPSPTGSLHVGNALSAVANRRLRRLDAAADRRHRPRAQRPGRRGGDPRDLEWLGVAWDEGPVRQSERAERHREAAGPLGDALRRRDAAARGRHADVPPRERRRRHRLRDHARRPRQRPPAERGAPPAAVRGARRDAARVRPPRPDPRRGRKKLAKRAAGATVASLREDGIPAEAVRAYLEELGLPRTTSTSTCADPAARDRDARGAAPTRSSPRRVGVPVAVAPVLRGARDLNEARELRRARPRAASRSRCRTRAPTLDALPRARRARDGLDAAKAIVRELKAVGGDLRALRLRADRARARARALAASSPRCRATRRCGGSMRLYDTLSRAARRAARAPPGPGPDVLLRPDGLPAGPHRQRAAVRDRDVAARWLRAARLRRRRSSTTSPTSTTRSTTPRPGASAELAARGDRSGTSRTRATSASACPTTLPKATETIPEIVAFIERARRTRPRVRGRAATSTSASRAFPSYGRLSRPAARPGRGAGAEPAQGGPARLRALEGEQAGRGHVRGTRRGARAGRAGTSSARRWPRSCSARRSRSTAAGSTSSSRTTRTSSPSRAALGHEFAQIWMHNGMLQLHRREDVEVGRQHRDDPRGARRVGPRDAAPLLPRRRTGASRSTSRDETWRRRAAQAERLPQRLPRPSSEPARRLGRASRPRSTTTSTRRRRSRCCTSWRDHELLRRGARRLRARVARRARGGAGRGRRARRAAARRRARRSDFAEADRLRGEIEAAGWEVRDVAGGFPLVPKP